MTISCLSIVLTDCISIVISVLEILTYLTTMVPSVELGPMADQSQDPTELLGSEAYVALHTVAGIGKVWTRIFPILCCLLVQFMKMNLTFHCDFP